METSETLSFFGKFGGSSFFANHRFCGDVPPGPAPQAGLVLDGGSILLEYLSILLFSICFGKCPSNSTLLCSPISSSPPPIFFFLYLVLPVIVFAFFFLIPNLYLYFCCLLIFDKSGSGIDIKCALFSASSCTRRCICKRKSTAPKLSACLRNEFKRDNKSRACVCNFFGSIFFQNASNFNYIK